MRSSAARAQPQAHVALASIGQVLEELAEQFPELTPSKLRFLEDQGLICPARTESGYRKFSRADIERVQFVLGLQRDHYLPLKVIRGYLDDLDAGRKPALPGATTATGSILPAGRRYTRDELLRHTGANAQLLDDAVAASLVTASDVYTDETADVLKALVDMRRAGIEPRHLRGLRASVERDAALIETATAAMQRRRDAPSRAEAAEQALELADRLEVVRGALLRAQIVHGRRATR